MGFRQLTSKRSIKILQSAMLLGCYLLVFSSCNKQASETEKNSPEYEKAYKEALVVHDKQGRLNALTYIDSVYRQIKSPTFKDNFDRLGFHYAVLARGIGDYKRAVVYADSLVSFLNENGGQAKHPKLYAGVNLILGDAAFELHDYPKAFQNYFTGYQLGKSYMDTDVTPAYLYRMGMVTYKQGSYKLSVNYFKQSLKLTLPLNNGFILFYRNQEIMDNIGMAYRNLNMLDSAQVFFNKGLAYIDQYGGKFPSKAELIPVAKAVIYGNQADVAVIRKDYNGAIQLLKKSIAINSAPKGDLNDALKSEIKLAKIYREQKEDDLLLALLQHIKVQLEYITSTEVEADWYHLMSEYYEKRGQLKSALDAYRSYHLLSDSLHNSRRLLTEMNVSDQISNYEKQHQIAGLVYNNRLQRIYLAVAVIATIMALIIIFLVYRNWQRSKRDLKTVNLLNDQVNIQKINLETALEKLNESNREKDRILYTVAHDLRNPLGGISSLSNIMATDADCNGEQREYINIIKETADNSLELIGEIFEATNATLDDSKKQLIDIDQLLGNVVELLRFKAAEKNQQIILCTHDNHINVFVVREKIWRVISNLIINAIKFSPVGTDIKINVEQQTNDVIISVSDDGIGIPEEMRSNVFNMFTEAKRPGTMGEKSFGLGLSICKQIVDAHGGKIWFDDKPGGGTTFYVQLHKAV